MSNIIEFILSDYDEIINKRRNEKYIKGIIRRIMDEKIIIGLFTGYLALLCIYMYVWHNNFKYKSITLTILVVAMVIVLVAYCICGEKLSIKESKNYYNGYKETQKKLMEKLKDKYKIITIEQLEIIIELCNDSIEKSRVTTKVSEDFKKISSTFILPTATFLGGIYISEYKPTVEEITAILIVIIFLTMLWIGIKYMVKPIFIYVLDFKSIRYVNLKARLNDLYVTYYMKGEDKNE